MTTRVGVIAVLVVTTRFTAIGRSILGPTTASTTVLRAWFGTLVIYVIIIITIFIIIVVIILIGRRIRAPGTSGASLAV